MVGDKILIEAVHSPLGIELYRKVTISKVNVG